MSAEATAERTYPCSECGKQSKNKVTCLDCRLQSGTFTFGISASSEGEDSTNASRVADGTAGFNLGLPPVDTFHGVRPNGTRAVTSRPITHNELPTKRKREDYAKAHGLVPMGDTKRAVGRA